MLAFAVKRACGQYDSGCYRQILIVTSSKALVPSSFLLLLVRHLLLVAMHLFLVASYPPPPCAREKVLVDSFASNYNAN